MITNRALKGREARVFLLAHALANYQITPEQQWRLFNAVYAWMVSDVARINRKPSVKKRYGFTPWRALGRMIKEVIVDLRYRGDNSPLTRSFFQSSVAYNDQQGFSRLMANEGFWVLDRGVPRERFAARNRYLERLR